MMRLALVGLILVTLGACGVEQATDSPMDENPLPPPPETGQDFHLSFDGVDDRVLVPWDESFPTEVFTAVAWIRLPAPPNGRAAIIARGEDDDSFNLTWQLYVGSGGELEAMLEASNEDNYCYPNNECVPFGSCVSGDRFVADESWHHVALTRDTNGTLVFYVDGEERARCEGTGTPSSNNRQFLSFGATHGTMARLSRAPSSPGLRRASASARIHSLYAAVKRRRFALSDTSGSGRPPSSVAARVTPVALRAPSVTRGPSASFLFFAINIVYRLPRPLH